MDLRELAWWDRQAQAKLLEDRSEALYLAFFAQCEKDSVFAKIGSLKQSASDLRNGVTQEDRYAMNRQDLADIGGG